MNINKFTQKSIEAVNQCEKIAYDYGNQEIDQEHFLYSLLTIEDSLIASLIRTHLLKILRLYLARRIRFQEMYSFM